MAGSLGLTLCICLCFWRTHCQVLQAPADLKTYPDLNSYPLPANTGGIFTYPTKTTQVYDEGVPITIAWNTTYEHISLYIAYVHNLSISAPVDGAGNSQRQLQTNTLSKSSDTFSWVASCDPDCNSPYELHIVNSRGTSQEVTGEGFWSDYFWIRASSRPEPDTSMATSATLTTSSSATSSAPSTTSTSATSIPTSSLAIPSTSLTISPQAPLATSISEPVSPSPSPAETGLSGLSTGVIVGISVGAVAIVLCAIVLGVFCCAMKKRGEKVPRGMMPRGSYEGDKAGSPTYLAMTSRENTHPQSASGQELTALDTIHPMNYSPTELAASHSPSELGPTR